MTNDFMSLGPEWTLIECNVRLKTQDDQVFVILIREFQDRAGQRGAEARQLGHAAKLGPVDLRHSLLDKKIENRVWRLQEIGDMAFDKTREGLNQIVAKHESLARDLILKMLGHR